MNQRGEEETGAVVRRKSRSCRPGTLPRPIPFPFTRKMIYSSLIKGLEGMDEGAEERGL
jgi:hypothetical protein